MVAFASGALIAVFFLPAWRIDLFAPQYPEGLTMNIWINGLSGDVDVINGLNHYIGMKHITVDMFPEFKFLPYVVGFFMLMGMAVAVTGSRRFLLFYLGLTVLGGALAMYDFYKWGYDYGHHLDPTAPIQVPGLSYQPPLFGHKRLLNFDAYSFPDVGGWIVIGAAGLAFGVWFAEWYRRRKLAKTVCIPNRALAASAIALTLSIMACSAKTEPIQFGKDQCSFCKMTIMDPKFGGEVVTKKGKVYKYDDVICLSQFLHSGIVKEEEIAQVVFVNFEKENDFISSEKAMFWVSSALRSPMGSNAACFSSPESAKKASQEKEGRLISWNELHQQFK